jgi:hypothetical protein
MESNENRQPGRDRPIPPRSSEAAGELGRHVHLCTSPNSCVGHLNPHSQGRATEEGDPMTSDRVCVGIDVSKDRGMWRYAPPLSGGRSPTTSRASPRSSPASASRAPHGGHPGGHWRPRPPPHGCPGRRGGLPVGVGAPRPELGPLTRTQRAALVGVAPLHRDGWGLHRVVLFASPYPARPAPRGLNVLPMCPAHLLPLTPVQTPPWGEGILLREFMTQDNGSPQC